MERTNLRLMGKEKGKETQVKGTKSIFKKIVEESFHDLKKKVPIKVRKAYRTQNRQGQKIGPPQYIVVKTLNVRAKKEF